MAKLIPLIVVVLSLCIPSQATSQEEEGEESYAPLPGGFRSILLGMSLDDVKEALLEDPYFNYRGDPDVSLLAEPNKTVIETDGAVYIARGFFQFHEGNLYIIHLYLDPDEIDHYSMFTVLSEKYGDPGEISPTASVWENEAVRISLERPLSVKYIEKRVFSQLLESSTIRESHTALSREDFLEQF